MEEQEWNELYQFLLERLRNRGFSEIAEEVEHAATHRLVEEELLAVGDRPLRPRRTASQRNTKKLELSDQLTMFDVPGEEERTIRSRAPRSQEAFDSAVEVLRTRLVEFPVLIAALADQFGHNLSEIRWLPDAEEGEVAAESTRFSPEEIATGIEQTHETEMAFHQLDELVRSARQ